MKKARYINPAIEKELAEFKEEIAEKHAKSEMNKTYVFKRSEIFVPTSQNTHNSLGTTDRLMSSGDAISAMQQYHPAMAKNKQKSNLQRSPDILGDDDGEDDYEPQQTYDSEERRK